MQACNRYGDCYSPEDALAHYFGDYEEDWSDDFDTEWDTKLIWTPTNGEITYD